MTVVLVDSSRFTQPYDAGLSRGLITAGLRILWATRPVRDGEPEQFPEGTVHDFFYRRFDQPDFLPTFLRGPAKGLFHIAGLFKLMALVRRANAGIVHFQWAALPIFDTVAMLLMKRHSRIVFTVHDTVPFNGERISLLQNLGFDLPIHMADAVIVHTETAARRLIERGHAAGKIHVIPHGPLELDVPLPPAPERDAGAPWVFTLFGRLKPYKGIDVLVAAIARTQDRLRGRARFIIAGEAYMDLTDIRDQIEHSCIGDLVDLRVGMLSEQEMAAIFVETDCFVFPYRQIDASGAYYLIAPFGKWMIATRVGVFADSIVQNVSGALIEPENVEALAAAILHAAGTRPTATLGNTVRSWVDIGKLTKVVYDDVSSAKGAMTHAE